jgi:hypothetical protein
MVGRLDGRYFAGDPSLYRSKKSNVLSHEINSREIGPKRVFKINEEKSASEGGAVNRIAVRKEFPQSQPVTHPRTKQNEELNRKDSILDTIEKTTNLKIMLDRHGSPGDVQKMMEKISSYCVTMGDCTPLDMALNEITKREKSKPFPSQIGLINC